MSSAPALSPSPTWTTTAERTRGRTDRGPAQVVRVNGKVMQGVTTLRGVGPDGDGDLDVALGAGVADCAVAVFWDDVDGELDQDAADTPSEPYGVGQAS